MVKFKYKICGMQVKLQRSNCNLYINDEMYNLKIATNKKTYEVQTQVSG
jgi:hypothetical protein